MKQDLHHITYSQNMSLGECIKRILLKENFFYLRLLLHHTPGCTSYEDIRTLPDGIICQTFKEAALKRGFLQDDEEWIECLNEAALTASPWQIRLLFVAILVFREPSCHDQLWNKFRNHMSQEFSRKNRHALESYIIGQSLKCIDDLLHQYGKSLEEFPGMPIPPESTPQLEELSNIMQYYARGISVQ